MTGPAETPTTYPATMPITIVEVLYPEVTQLDFTGPHTVFTRIPGAEVIVASAAGGEITSDDGLRFAGTVALDAISACDVLFVPGGMGAAAACVDEVLIGELRRLAATPRYVTSVYTGSLVSERRAARRQARRLALGVARPAFPFRAIPDDHRVVRDGDHHRRRRHRRHRLRVTIAAELAGDTAAQGIQLAIEYAPAPPFSAGRPETAPTDVRIAAEARNAHFRAARMDDIDIAVRRLESLIATRSIRP